MISERISLQRVTISKITHKFLNESQTNMNGLFIVTTGGSTNN